MHSSQSGSCEGSMQRSRGSGGEATASLRTSRAAAKQKSEARARTSSDDSDALSAYGCTAQRSAFHVRAGTRPSNRSSSADTERTRGASSAAGCSDISTVRRCEN